MAATTATMAATTRLMRVRTGRPWAWLARAALLLAATRALVGAEVVVLDRVLPAQVDVYLVGGQAYALEAGATFNVNLTANVRGPQAHNSAAAPWPGPAAYGTQRGRGPTCACACAGREPTPSALFTQPATATLDFIVYQQNELVRVTGPRRSTRGAVPRLNDSGATWNNARGAGHRG